MIAARLATAPLAAQLIHRPVGPGQVEQHLHFFAQQFICGKLEHVHQLGQKILAVRRRIYLHIQAALSALVAIQPVIIDPGRHVLAGGQAVPQLPVLVRRQILHRLQRQKGIAQIHHVVVFAALNSPDVLEPGPLHRALGIAIVPEHLLQAVLHIPCQPPRKKPAPGAEQIVDAQPAAHGPLGADRGLGIHFAILPEHHLTGLAQTLVRLFHPLVEPQAGQGEIQVPVLFSRQRPPA